MTEGSVALNKQITTNFGNGYAQSAATANARKYLPSSSVNVLLLKRLCYCKYSTRFTRISRHPHPSVKQYWLLKILWDRKHSCGIVTANRNKRFEDWMTRIRIEHSRSCLIFWFRKRKENSERPKWRLLRQPSLHAPSKSSHKKVIDTRSGRGFDKPRSWC